MNEHQYCEDHDVKPGEGLRRLLVVILTGTRPVLAGRLQRASIENDRNGLPVSALHDPDDRTQVLKIFPQHLPGLPVAVSAASLIALTVFNPVPQRWFGNRPLIYLARFSIIFSAYGFLGRFVEAVFHHDRDYSHYISRRSGCLKINLQFCASI